MVFVLEKSSKELNGRQGFYRFFGGGVEFYRVEIFRVGIDGILNEFGVRLGIGGILSLCLVIFNLL